MPINRIVAWTSAATAVWSIALAATYLDHIYYPRPTTAPKHEIRLVDNKLTLAEKDRLVQNAISWVLKGSSSI